MDRDEIGRSDTDIAQSWTAHYTRNGPPQSEQDIGIHPDDPDFWATETLMDLQFDDPVRALEIVFLIARDADDDWVLENLGAGPLESLLAADPTFLDAVALEMRSSPRLKGALQCVWQNTMSDETWAQVQRLAAP